MYDRVPDVYNLLSQHHVSDETVPNKKVFYSKDTVKIGGMSIADYIFADMTDVSGQDKPMHVNA